MMLMPRPSPEAFHAAICRLESQFFARVRKTASCWLWVGSKVPSGYGSFGFIVDGFRTTIRAHRMGWHILKGPAPPGLLGCHICDIRDCVNPDHIFWGTQSDNMQDCSRKGRLVARGCSWKTYCVNGHPFSSDNTIVDGQGRRHCRQCRKYRNGPRRIELRALRSKEATP